MVVNQKTIIMNYFTRSKKNGDTEDRLVEEPADPWCDPSWRVLQPSYVGIKKLLTFMVAVMFSFGLYAQLNVSKGKVIINFGIDADVHSGVVTYNSFGDAAFGTDDWFSRASGLGVIDGNTRKCSFSRTGQSCWTSSNVSTTI